MAEDKVKDLDQDPQPGPVEPAPDPEKEQMRGQVRQLKRELTRLQEYTEEVVRGDEYRRAVIMGMLCGLAVAGSLVALGILTREA